MVHLDRIYTRGGDRGMTSLGDGTRVPKTDPRIVAYGTVDELNAVLGVVVRQPGLGTTAKRQLRDIQNDLFDVGADLCVPRPSEEAAGARLRVAESQVARLERAIDAYTAALKPLQSFVLPGGSAAAAWLHMGRVVCRRAEQQVAALLERAPGSTGDQVLVYLNRLSDLLFVMARWANDRGRGDVLWIPGANRDAGAPKRTAGPKPERAARKNPAASARPGAVRRPRPKR